MKVKLTNPLQEPFKHQELVDESGNYLEYANGDVIDVNSDTAEHLIRSNQAVMFDTDQKNNDFDYYHVFKSFVR